MRITPLDIQQKQFKVKLRGFDMEEVYSFLELVREELEELLKENITRQMEIDAELEIKDQEECVEVQEETQNLPCQKAIR